MVMRMLREGVKNTFIKFVLFGLLIAATMGLVFSDIGGFFRGGNFGSNDVARIGDARISLQEFDRDLRPILQRANISAPDAYAAGFMNQILASKVREHLVDQSAQDLGLSMDKRDIAKRLRDIVLPMTGPGQTEADVLRQILSSNGMTEGQLVQAVGREMKAEMLAEAFTAAALVPDSATLADLYAWQNESRALELVRFDDIDIKDLPKADEAALREVYDVIKEDFASDETRDFRIITIDEQALRKSVKVTDEDVRNEYDSNAARFDLPARKTIEQALLLTEDTAQKIADALKTNKNLKAAVEKITGKTSDYLGLQDFTDEALPDAIRTEALAAKEAGTVIGPLKTPLGWQIAVVKEIRQASTTSFEDAQKDIRAELESSRSDEALFAQVETLDDLLASNTALEDLQKQIPIKISTIKNINHFGQNSAKKNALEGLPDDLANLIVTKGFELENEGAATPAEELKDGRFTAIQLTKLTPKIYKPFEDVKDEVAKRWADDQRRVANQALVSGYIAGMIKDETTLQNLAKTYGKRLERFKNVARGEEPPAPLNARNIELVFDAPVGQPIMIDIEGGKAIMKVTEARLPSSIKTDTEKYAKLAEAFKNDANTEILSVYLEAQNRIYKASINQDLLQRAYGQEAAAE
jgi:peptidyl-prolyl cis-trans isomerase D